MYFFLALGYCALIFWLSHQPDPPQPQIEFPLKDKVSHIVLYGVLAAILSVGMWQHRKPHPRRRLFWAPVIFVFAFGTFDEFHQWTVPGRFFDPFDVVANTVGGFLASLVLTYLYSWHAARQRGAVASSEAAYAPED